MRVQNFQMIIQICKIKSKWSYISCLEGANNKWIQCWKNRCVFTWRKQQGIWKWLSSWWIRRLKLCQTKSVCVFPLIMQKALNPLIILFSSFFTRNKYKSCVMTLSGNQNDYQLLVFCTQSSEISWVNHLAILLNTHEYSYVKLMSGLQEASLSFFSWLNLQGSHKMILGFKISMKCQS